MGWLRQRLACWSQSRRREMWKYRKRSSAPLQVVWWSTTWLIPDLETPTQHQVASSRSEGVESIPRIQPGCAIASFEGGNQRQCAVQEILECGAHRLVQSANIGGVTSTPECAMDIEVADFGSNGPVPGSSTRARKDDDDCSVVRISPSCSAVGSDFAGLMYQTTEDASSRVQAGINQVAGRSTRARKDDDDRGVVRISPSCSAVDSDSAGLVSQTTVVGSSTRARSDDDDRSVILISPCGSAVDSDFAGLMSQTTVGSNRRSFGSFLFQKGRTSPGICTVDTDFVGRCL